MALSPSVWWSRECQILTFASLLTLIPLLMLFQPARSVYIDATCYSINGIENTDFPCFLGQNVSACCGAGSICLDNGLCEPEDSDGVSDIIRGSCTDQEWLSPSCPQYCKGADLGGTNLISCLNVTNDQSDFCCDHTNGCCDSGIGRFRVSGAFTPVVTIESTGADFAMAQPTTRFSSLTTSTSSRPFITTSSTKIKAVTSAAVATSTPAVVAAATMSAQSSSLVSIPSTLPPSSMSTSTPPTGKNAMTVGVGVGIAGMFLAITAISTAWYLLRKRRRTQVLDRGFSQENIVRPQQVLLQTENERYEVGGVGRPTEMESDIKYVYELPTTGVWEKSG